MKNNYAVLFDLDGTLLNTDKVIFESYKHTFAILRPEYILSEGVMLSFLGPAISENMSRFFQGNELEEAVEIYRTYCDAHHDEMVYAYDTVKDTLKQLHDSGYPIGVVTTKAVEPAKSALEHNGLLQYISCVIGYESVPSTKPDPEGVRLALATLECSEGVMVGDNDVDVLAGKRAGIDTISVKWSLKGYEHLEVLEPDMLIDEMLQVLDFVSLKGLEN